MIYILTSIFIFFLSAILHIIFSRIMPVNNKRIIIKFAGNFVIGFIILVFLTYAFLITSLSQQNTIFYMPLPLSSLLLYVLLVILYLIYYMGTVAGEESPSIKLYMLLKKRKEMTFDQIRKAFAQSKFIEDRLVSLETGNFIKKEKHVFKLTSKGTRLVALSNWYRTFLKWESSG